MKSTIGVYETHEQAVEAVSELKEANYPINKLSIISKAETEVIDSQMHIMPKDPIKVGGLTTGTALGATLGILTGVGIFAIPGLGFLYGAGALVGAIAGFDFGLIGGGIASVLMTIGVSDEEAKKYHTYLEEGKYLLIAQGSEEEVYKAKDILHEHGTHSSVATH